MHDPRTQQPTHHSQTSTNSHLLASSVRPQYTQYEQPPHYYMTAGFQAEPANMSSGSYSQQSYSVASGNPEMLHRQPYGTSVEEMAELQQELIDENKRLRNEMHRIEQMFEKIETNNRQNKLERARLKEERDSLKLSSKKLKQQQDQLDYKRQQIEKETIKLNKAKQKLRRLPQNVAQVQQICQVVQASQLFERIRFEANLTLQDD